MIDEQKVFLRSAGMAEHANGAALYLGALSERRFPIELRYGTMEKDANKA